MKKIMIMSLGAGALMFTACDRSNTGTTTDTSTGVENSTIDESATNASGGITGTDQETLYRDRASRTSGQMATDLQLDDQTRTRAEEIHYNRAQRRAEVQQRFTSDTTGMASEMRNIDTETDRQFKNILTEDQYRTYETNRSTYADRDNYELNRTGTGTGTQGTGTQGTGTQGTGTQGDQNLNRGTGTGTGTQGTGTGTQGTGTQGTGTGTQGTGTQETGAGTGTPPNGTRR
jgi:hypothetical protein